jgi:hypothetical protein
MEVAGGDNKFADTALTPGARGNPHGVGRQSVFVRHHIRVLPLRASDMLGRHRTEWSSALGCNIDDATLPNLTIRLTNK